MTNGWHMLKWIGSLNGNGSVWGLDTLHTISSRSGVDLWEIRDPNVGPLIHTQLLILFFHHPLIHAYPSSDTPRNAMKSQMPISH